jgi:hypothetical protein
MTLFLNTHRAATEHINKKLSFHLLTPKHTTHIGRVYLVWADMQHFIKPMLI